jgi:hypothetical protein
VSGDIYLVAGMQIRALDGFLAAREHHRRARP